MKRFLIAFCLCMCLLPAFASAGTSYSGTVGQDTGWLSVNFNDTSVGADTSGFILWANDIEYSGGISSFIHFDLAGHPATFDAGAPKSASTPITLSVGSHVIATGTYGYQRNYNTAWPTPTEIAGYQYMTFDFWDVGSLSGDVVINTTFDANATYNCTYKNEGIKTETDPTSGTFAIFQSTTAAIAKMRSGYYTINKNVVFLNGYDVEQSDTTAMVEGTITKSVSGTTYNGRAMVFSDKTGALITSESIVTPDNFTFVLTPQDIIIGSRDPLGNIWNSSTLVFHPVGWTPTPTATPAPTGTPITPQNPIPAGYVRSMAECVDGQTSGRLAGCDIQMFDVENASWNNVTAGRGYWFIDTLPNHTVNAYGQLDGYSSVERLDQPASGTRMIELVMWPDDVPAAATGKVNLYVLVHDDTSMYAINGAEVSVRDSATGLTQAKTTGSSGAVMFQVTNATTMYITAEKFSYISETVPFETTDFGPDTKRIELEKATVTAQPTSTIPPGGVTTAVTIDPAGTPDPAGGPSGYSNAKGQQMLDWLAMNGMSLVQLCFMVTILALLGVKFGGR